MSSFRLHLSGRGFLIISKELETENVKIEPQEKGMGLLVTVVISSSSIEAAEKDGLEWMAKLEEAIALTTRVWVEFKLEGIDSVPSKSDENEYLPSRGYVSFASIIPKTIGPDLAAQAISLIPKLSSFSGDDLVTRAVRWYARGIEDDDFVDKFIDHWIGLETLSGLFEGPLEPYKCPDCGRTINPRPQGAMLLGFVRSLNLPVDPTNYIRAMRKIRGRLFHEASAIEDARLIQPFLTDLLNACILRCLDKKPTESSNE